MATTDKPGGILRTDYETDRAWPDDFPLMGSDRLELLLRLAEASSSICYRDGEREGTLFGLYENHVLTVLAEIVRTDVSGGQFVEVSGTVAQTALVDALRKKAAEWVKRLEIYIGRHWQGGHGDSPAVCAARRIKEQIESVLHDTYHRLLRTLSDIREHSGTYLPMVEDSGDMNGALALLFAYLRNYSGVAEAFNCRFATLPELCRRDILHTGIQDAVQDHTYIIVTPTEGTDGFTLPKGQSFYARQNAAGDDLIYQTVGEEYISPMQCAEVNAVYLQRKKNETTSIRKQAIRFQEASAVAETLFADRHSQNLSLGWLVESSMLVLDEGERKVSIRFRLTVDTGHEPLPEIFSPRSFILQFSSGEGWKEQKCTYRTDTTNNIQRLCFDFIIAQGGDRLTPCTEEMHGMTSEYPAIRILTNNEECPYDRLSKLNFDAIEIRTEVTGIRNFTFYNELGEVDTSQPFYPFGIEAEKDAWFLFGNEEIGLKPLQKVQLKGFWKKLPKTEAEFNKVYKSYITTGQAVRADSFAIATEWRQGGKWHACTGGEQHLFVPDNGEERSLSHAEVIFDFEEDTVDPYTYSHDKYGFFRATLQAPLIGFGTDAYRSLFTETMLHNSHCKEKKRKDLPSEPIIPMLTDVELSYIASEETTLAEIESSSVRLRRITAMSEEESFPIGKVSEQSFLPAVPADHLLYFAFFHAQGEQKIRIYPDLVLPKEKIPFYSPQPGKSIKLSWEYWNGNSWRSVSIQSIVAEETCGLTQSGFVEIKLPEKIKDSYMDKQGRTWIRAAVTGDVSSCLAIRSIWTNCIRLTARNGDGLPLPVGTIQEMKNPDGRIESIFQPLPGFGGRPAETETQSAVRQSSRIYNRHRALTIKDYEQLVLEHFPEVDKVQCIPVPQEHKASKICLVVFSRAEDSRYCLSQAWKLAEIQRLIRQYAPPFVSLQVINPVYERVKVHCKAVLWDSVQDENKAIRQLVVLAQNYIAPWYRKKEIPALRRSFSYKELHARMVNHEDLMKLVALEVDMECLPHTDINEKNPIFKGSHPWSVLLPEIKIELLSLHDGIDEAEIGSNFIIG